MSWGNSWGRNGWSNSKFSSGGWGGSSSGCGNNKDPEGQHNSTCIAGTGSWGHSGLMKKYYDENCSGCRHERAASTWSSRPSGENPALKLVALFGIGYIAKKSLWD